MQLGPCRTCLLPLVLMVFVLPAAVFSVSAPRALAADWLQWRGPNRSGVSPETGWLTTWPTTGPKVLWRSAVGEGYSSVAVQGGRVYTMGNKADADTVWCLDAATGGVVWKDTYSCRGGPSEGGPRATPVLDGQALYTVSRHGDVRCLDAASGKPLWAVRLPDVAELKGSVPRGGLNEVSGSPLVDGQRLILSAESVVVALDKATGRFAWVQKEAGTGGHSSPLAFDMAGERCVLIFGGQEAVGLSVRTGEKLWGLPWKNTANAADPSVIGTRVFFSSGYQTGCAMLEPARGDPKVVWRNKLLGTQFSSAVFWQGHLYGFDGHARNKVPVVCLDAETGHEKWRQHGLDMGTLMIAGGKLVMLSETGVLAVAEASPGGYKELARAKVLDGLCWTVPVLSGGRIYCRNHEGELVCLDVRAGAATR